VFIPKPLPPNPPIVINSALTKLLSKADHELALLDGETRTLPDPDLFVAMYVKKEALLSSQIEGTVATLLDVLEFEADLTPRGNIEEAKNVSCYLKALNWSVDLVRSGRPITMDVLLGTHKLLLSEGRGSDRSPGVLRTSQVHIGNLGEPITNASFVPPPPEFVPAAVYELLDYMNSADDTPPLVSSALLHAQLETIHPFRDGNGRIGRLLITLFLMSRGYLKRPVLYLSYYLKRRKPQYGKCLNGVRFDGACEDWVAFFLKGKIGRAHV